MKYAGKTFTLYASEPVAVQGSDSLYTYQNTGTGTATLQGSNNGKDWVTITTVTSGASSISSHSYAFLRMTGSTEVSVSRGAAGDNSFSSSNPLPVAQPDGLAVSGTATSAAVLFTTSMIGYEGLTLQITSAGSSCTITYEASEDQITWYSTAVMSASVLGASNSLLSFAGTATNALLQLYTQRRGSYFRARVSIYGSGTVSIQGVLTKTCPTLFVDARLTGYAGEGAAVSGTAPPIALEARTGTKTVVTNGQSVRKIGTVDGRQIVRLDAIPENEWSYVAGSGGITNTTTAVTLAGGAGSGARNYITSLQVYSDTLGTATEVVIQDGVAGPILWRAKIGTAGTVGIQNIRFHPPLRGSSNTLVEAACVTATGTGSIYLNVQGYKAP